MLSLLAAPLGLTAPRGHAAAAARVPSRAPALAALAAGSSSALSFEEWCAAGPASPSSDPNQRCLTCSSPTRSPSSEAWPAPTPTLQTPTLQLTRAAASGIRAPKLFIDDVQELRGATARAPLAAGEELCRVPRGRTLDLASVAPGESPCPDLAPPRLWSSLAWCEPRTRGFGCSGSG